MTDFFAALPPDWAERIGGLSALRGELNGFLDGEYTRHTVYPPREDLFSAFRLTPFASVRAVILGQDPYHEPGQAHGIAFSVRGGVRFPPSLRNILTEYAADTALPVPDSGSLVPWAIQGVLLLNTVLTVREHEANSHSGRGWERFTDAVIRAVNAKPEPVVFLLWGSPAQSKRLLITAPQHKLLCAPHPSPLSAWRGFFGSHPFSSVNALLREAGRPEIDWRLPDRLP